VRRANAVELDAGRDVVYRSSRLSAVLPAGPARRAPEGGRSGPRPGPALRAGPAAAGRAADHSSGPGVRRLRRGGGTGPDLALTRPESRSPAVGYGLGIANGPAPSRPDGRPDRYVRSIAPRDLICYRCKSIQIFTIET